MFSTKTTYIPLGGVIGKLPYLYDTRRTSSGWFGVLHVVLSVAVITVVFVAPVAIISPVVPACTSPAIILVRTTASLISSAIVVVVKGDILSCWAASRRRRIFGAKAKHRTQLANTAPKTMQD